MTSQSALEFFHPLIQEWFTDKNGKPTDIQIQAWTEISRGKHALLTAPTGCGKTLAAFLWAINQLITGQWQTGRIRVLYVSPLKALNNDVQKNLIEPLNELRQVFRNENLEFPSIQIETRSGDTPQRDRQRMLRHPPEVFITTPESLNLMLSSPRARNLFTGLAAVILDEIHAVTGTKRGTHLITAVDRLVSLTGEFQRIGLSATIRPLHQVADFLGGYMMEKQGQDYVYTKRKVQVLESGMDKEFQLMVLHPGQTEETDSEDNWWGKLVTRLLQIIETHTSTLIFTNSRRHAEKITRLINEEAGEQYAYSHHGSLSREIRYLVEQKLKNGELKAIVATSSLELGIDIGALDEVILIQAPFTISSGIQRIGRAGHSVGDTSKAVFFPLHGRDFINCAVAAKSVMEREIEETRIPNCPLDMLAQVIVSMTGVEVWDKDYLYAMIKTSYPFHSLKKEQYAMVLDMLAGRFADSRIRELQPRISLDKIDNTVSARSGALQTLYLSGGAIPDRGYYNMRIGESKALVGELDEEFVWERSVGDVFTFGTQVWRIEKIDHQNVEVVPLQKAGGMIPFWRAEPYGRDFFYAEKIGLFLETYNDKLDIPETLESLVNDFFLAEETAREIIRFLQLQREITGTDLPHRHHLLIEHFSDPLNRTDMKQIILHTQWGGKINGPYSIALSAAWEDKYGYPLQVFHDNECLMLNLPHDFEPADIFELVTSVNLEKLLRKKLETTGFFGARFRENAARALLLPRQSFKKRLPLWFNRMRSKKLLNAISRYDDFPILAETWRTCLQDEFDLVNLKLVLDEIREGLIIPEEVFTTRASPFASGLVWQQTNKYMYEDDTPLSQRASQLRSDIIKDLVFTSELRPQIPISIIEEFTQKVQRTFPGYSPRNSRELLDWLKERFLIPVDEWEILVSAMERDHEISRTSILGEIQHKINIQTLEDARFPSVIASENLSRLEKAVLQKRASTVDTGDVPQLLSGIIEEWLHYYGPLEKTYPCEVFGLAEEQTTAILDMLIHKQAVMKDLISEGSTVLQICDTENLERLLRLKARQARPIFKPLELSSLPLFLAGYQGLINKGDSMEGLQKSLEALMGYTAPAKLWESEIFPARLDPYYISWLDTLLQETGLQWYGTKKDHIGFCFEGEDEVFRHPKRDDGAVNNIFPDSRGRYNFWDLQEYSGMSSDELSQKLWELTWQGILSNDQFATLRSGVLNKFRAPVLPVARKTKRSLRPGFSRWKQSRPLTGNWFLLRQHHMPSDMLEKEDIVRNRVRQLLLRYGILFRELLEREIPELRWQSIFRSLRIMELSGEILTGHFFTGIPGIQFASHEAYRYLQQELPQDAIYWMNAMDPASLCGVKLPLLKGVLPNRIVSNHLVYHGERLVLVSRKNAENLEFNILPHHTHIVEYIQCLRGLLNRQYQPLNSLKVATINKVPAFNSSYAEVMQRAGFRKEYKYFILEAV